MEKKILIKLELVDLVTSPICGAISTFIGTTRDNFEGKKVKTLEYEAYQGMAEKALLKLCQDIASKYDVFSIAIAHRTGIVEICEASVIIAISSKHRLPSLQAIQYAIDTLKKDVPIWKKEIYEGESVVDDFKKIVDGEYTWKANNESKEDKDKKTISKLLT